MKAQRTWDMSKSSDSLYKLCSMWAGETEVMGGALDSAPIPGARSQALSDEESSDSEGDQNTTVVERE